MNNDEIKKLLAREFFTTGRIAKLLNVAPRTVATWIDKGELVGFRLPSSKDRRVSKKDLFDFIKSHGIRVSWEDQEDTWKDDVALKGGTVPAAYCFIPKDSSNEYIGNCGNVVLEDHS